MTEAQNQFFSRQYSKSTRVTVHCCMLAYCLYSVFITGPAMHGAAQQQLAQTTAGEMVHSARNLECASGAASVQPRAGDCKAKNKLTGTARPRQAFANLRLRLSAQLIAACWQSLNFSGFKKEPTPG